MSKRPRGFALWAPQRKTRRIIDGVRAVLGEYQDHLPMTIRQIFYRLVAQDLIDKTEKAYGSLCEHVGRARRAGMISMDAIRDDGFSGSLHTGVGYDSPDDWIATIIDDADSYRRDRQAGQDTRLLVWCEASGMLPQLERVALPYGISVASSGGFDSLTVKHTAGEELGDDDPVKVLHIGDYDPSGECMFDALDEDIRAFAGHYGNRVTFSRLAVTPDQITAYGLPTAPPKDSSHQARKRMTETIQCEALDPATMAGIVRAAIESRFDMDVYRMVVQREEVEREALKKELRRMMGR